MKSEKKQGQRVKLCHQVMLFPYATQSQKVPCLKSCNVSNNSEATNNSYHQLSQEY